MEGCQKRAVQRISGRARGAPLKKWHDKKKLNFATNYFLLSDCRCNVNGTLNGTICDKSTGDCGSCKKGFFGGKCEKGIIFLSQKLVFCF